MRQPSVGRSRAPPPERTDRATPRAADRGRRSPRVRMKTTSRPRRGHDAEAGARPHTSISASWAGSSTRLVAAARDAGGAQVAEAVLVGVLDVAGVLDLIRRVARVAQPAGTKEVGEARGLVEQAVRVGVELLGAAAG